MRRRTPVLVGVAVAALALTLPAVGAQQPGGAQYTTYAQKGAAGDAGEPSIGVSWRTGATFLQAGLETDRVTFGKGGRSTWRGRRRDASSATRRWTRRRRSRRARRSNASTR